MQTFSEPLFQNMNTFLQIGSEFRYYLAGDVTLAAPAARLSSFAMISFSAPLC
jgi:hypothetical protein